MLRPVTSEDDRGATSVEYALIASLIAVVIVAAVMLLGRNVQTLFGNTATLFSNINSG